MKPYILALLFLLFTKLVTSGSPLPAHAKLIPGNVGPLLAFNFGQILEKVDHEGLINKAMVANLYSASSGFSELVMELDTCDAEDRKRHGFITELIEKPADTSGIDLSQPVFLYMNGPLTLDIRLAAKITGPEAFERFINRLNHFHRYKKGKWKDTEGGRRQFHYKSGGTIAHDGEYLIMRAIFLGPNKKAPDSDPWFEDLEKDSVAVPEFLSQHLQASPDLGLFFQLKPLLPLISQALKPGQTAPDYLQKAKLFVAFNSRPGELVAEADLDVGKGNELNFAGEPVGQEFLNYLEKDAFLHGAMSINLGAVLPHIKFFLPFLGTSAQDLDEELLEEFNLGLDDLVALFSGQVAFSLNGFDGEGEEPTFLAAIGTNGPAIEAYTKIFKKGLLQALKGESRDAGALARLSISAQDEILLISTKDLAPVHENGKAKEPIGKPLANSLVNGMFNMLMEFSALQEAIPQDELGEEEAMVINGVLPQLAKYNVQVRQTSTHGYKETYSVTFKNRKDQALRTIAHLAADLANPVYRNPEARAKLLAAEEKALKNPGKMAKDIVGTWSGTVTDPDAATHYKLTLSEDGKMQYKEIHITEEGFSRMEYTNRYVVSGNTYKDYNEDGGLEFIAKLLHVGESTLSYYDVFDWEMEEDPELVVENRVFPGFQLPKPPEGLKELDSFEIGEDEEDGSSNEPVLSPPGLE